MPTLRRKGRYWYLRTTEGGRDKEVATRCTDRRAAEGFLRQWERDRADPDGAPRRAAATTTVQQAVDLAHAHHLAEHRVGKLAEATVDHYLRKLGAVLTSLGADTALSELTTARLDRFVTERREDGASDHTIHKELHVLREALRLAGRQGLCPRSAHEDVPHVAPAYKPRDRSLSVDEVRAILGELEGDRAAWVAWAVGSGAERAALERAERADYDERAGLVRVRGTKNARRARVVPVVLPECKALLRLALERAEGVAPKLLGPWHNVWRDLREAAKRAGASTTGLSVHVLRHTWASWHLAAGVSWDDVARGLGHASTAMLHKTYAHLSPSELRSRYLPGDRVETVEPVQPVHAKVTGKQALSGAGGQSRTDNLGIMIPSVRRGTTTVVPLFLAGNKRRRRASRADSSRDLPGSARAKGPR